MKDWKLNQHLYHLTTVPADVFPHSTYVIHSHPQLVDDVINYFSTDLAGVLIYPAKSYAVALIYSHLLTKYFKEDFFVALDDPMLLFGNDRYFVRYSDDKDTYDSIIQHLTNANLWDVETSPFAQVRSTVSYFTEEFLITETTELTS